MDALNFIQWVHEPTHTHGHTLDLIFTHGFSTGLSDILISDTGFSDHKSICFNASIPWRPVSTAVQTRWIRHFTSNAVEEFASAYTTFHPVDFTDTSPVNSNVDEYLYSFNDKCLNILNSVAPMKAKRNKKKKSEPWLMTQFVRSDKYAGDMNENGLRINCRSPMIF